MNRCIYCGLECTDPVELLAPNEVEHARSTIGFVLSRTEQFDADQNSIHLQCVQQFNQQASKFAEHMRKTRKQ